MQGLLLDYGGVLTSSVVESFGKFCVDEDIDVEVFRRVVLDHARTPDSVFSAVEVGRIPQEEFDEQLAALLSDALGKRVEPRGLKQRLFAHSVPDERMLVAVLRLRAGGVRTALVSNSWGGNDYPRERFGDLFDAVVISGEVGLRKPEPGIFLLAASNIGVEPSQCVFVDDFKVNIAGAEAVGMTGVHHRSTDETIARLQELFGAELSSAEAG
jgi:epoxide hydrolase-like predicted phosphatase